MCEDQKVYGWNADWKLVNKIEKNNEEIRREERFRYLLHNLEFSEIRWGVSGAPGIYTPYPGRKI